MIRLMVVIRLIDVICWSEFTVIRLMKMTMLLKTPIMPYDVSMKFLLDVLKLIVVKIKFWYINKTSLYYTDQMFVVLLK